MDGAERSLDDALERSVVDFVVWRIGQRCERETKANGFIVRRLNVLLGKWVCSLSKWRMRIILSKVS